MTKISLRAARVNAGYTQEEVGKILKVKRDRIIEWEKGRKMPKKEVFNQLCELYGIQRKDLRI